MPLHLSPLASDPPHGRGLRFHPPEHFVQPARIHERPGLVISTDELAVEDDHGEGAPSILLLQAQCILRGFGFPLLELNLALTHVILKSDLLGRIG